MTLGWRDGVVACEADGRGVLLDMFVGRFAELSAPALAALKRIEQSPRVTECEHRELQSLLAAGLLVAGRKGGATIAAGLLVAGRKGGATILTKRSCPAGQFQVNGMARSTASEVAMAVVAQLAARAVVRACGLRFALLRSPSFDRRVVSTEGEHSGPAVHRIVHAFERSDLLVGRRDRCLPRSLSLRAMARRSGCDACLVIGVKGAPFAAHSWVESEGLVLGDDLDVVRLFTPLLVR